MAKIVVCGGCGYIGQHIAKELAKNPKDLIVLMDVVPPDWDIEWPDNVVWVDGDIRYMDEVLRITQGAQEVYQVAGSLGTSELIFQSGRATDTNVRGTVNVLEACRVNKVDRVFYPTKPNEWLNTYSISKFAGEQYALMYQQQFEMNICVLKWFNAYGPRQHPYPVRKLIPTLCMQAIYGQPLTIFGNGSQTVDLIHVEDIAKIAVQCTRTMGRVPKVLDVGSGVAVTVLDVAQRVLNAAKSISSYQFKPMRAGEPEDSDIQADVLALQEVMEIPTRDLDEALRATVAYYRKLSPVVVRNSFRYWGERFDTEVAEQAKLKYMDDCASPSETGG